jgi:alpha-tubulin suppressor-like RCC1 family protein
MKKVLLLVLVSLVLPTSASAQQACSFGSFIGEGESYEISTPSCFGPENVISVQASNDHDLLLTSTGEVQARGNNGSGQLGTGNTNNNG